MKALRGRTGRRASPLIRRIAAAVLACLAAAASVAINPGGVGAKDGHDTQSGMVLDLVAHTPAGDATPVTVTLRVADAHTHAGAVLGVRLHEPVRTRDDLWAAAMGPAPTPESSNWVIQDWRSGPAAGDAVLVSIPITPPDESSDDDRADPGIRGPRPLHIELTAVDGTPIDTLRTFLLPAPADLDSDLAVAVVVDLRLPPAHTPDGSAAFEQASLSRVLDVAQVLIDHPDTPLTVHLNGETLDALALIGDDESLSVLLDAARGRPLLLSPWTTLDIGSWIAAGRADVVVDGLDRGREALGWAGLEVSTVMRFDRMPSVVAASLVADSVATVTGFVGSSEFSTPLEPPDPVTVVVDAAGDWHHPVAQTDPLLEAALRNGDPELAAQWTLAELARLSLEDGEPEAVVVVVAAVVAGWDAYNRDAGGSSRPFLLPGTEPATIELLLGQLDVHRFLRPVSVDSLLTGTAPVGAVEGADRRPPTDPGFSLYLTERAGTEERLHAYESLIGAGRDSTFTAPLHTLLAASTNLHLTTGQRLELAAAVDRAVAQDATGVELVQRGAITVTEPSADLPVTLMNSRPSEVTVALDLTSNRFRVAEDERLVLTLQPGRNDLAVPVVAAAPGSTLVTVTVATPDEAGAITLTSGTLRVRFVDADRVGLMVLVTAVVALGAWWLHSLRRRSRDIRRGGATVAAPDTAGDDADN